MESTNGSYTVEKLIPNGTAGQKHETLLNGSSKAGDSLEQARRTLAAGVRYSLGNVQPDGHWVGELRSNPTVTAEYIFLFQALGLSLLDSATALKRWFISIQHQDGSWGIAPNYPGDISTTTEVYLALKILGMTVEDRVMTRAQDYMYLNGGIANVRVFTRIYLATFGLFPWKAVPEMPAELIFMPAKAPINIYKFSSWARSTIVPLLIICHHQPIYALPNGRSMSNDFLDELWYVSASHSNIDKVPSLWDIWWMDWVALLFKLIDNVLYIFGGLRSSPTRPYARRKCTNWLLQHQETTGDWAGIFPPMHLGLLALILEGHSLEDGPVRLGLEAIEKFAWQDTKGKRVQACVSPVWDTALMTISLRDAGLSSPAVDTAVTWLRDQQIVGPEGDWRIYSPDIISGGFCFEYSNVWYPDIDDTAAVILAFVKADPKSSSSMHVMRAVEWILGMQNRDGGWAAFDKNNDKLFLNKIPFSDMDSLCDPSTADVTGRVLEAFGLLLRQSNFPTDLRKRVSIACDLGIGYLDIDQLRSGPWYGRWGVNYVYGTSNVLCGLQYFMDRPRVPVLCHTAVRWLRSVQNVDGGWGECLESYSDPGLAGKGDSTPSQTAWGLMGLLAGKNPVEDRSFVNGLRWLITNQKYEGMNGTWYQAEYTGTGFPNHFYLDYDLYRHYFPLMAMGRFVEKASASQV